MRKNVWGALLLSGVIMSSCAVKKSSYDAAYQKAKEKETPQVEQPTQIPAPEEETVEVVRTTPVYTPVRKEKVEVVNAADKAKLKSFGIVMGAFGVKTNADAVIRTLQAEGYQPFAVMNEKQQYRVILESFERKEDAATRRDEIKNKYRSQDRYQDIWLLEREF